MEAQFWVTCLKDAHMLFHDTHLHTIPQQGATKMAPQSSHKPKRNPVIIDHFRVLHFCLHHTNTYDISVFFRHLNWVLVLLQVGWASIDVPFNPKAHISSSMVIINDPASNAPNPTISTCHSPIRRWMETTSISLILHVSAVLLKALSTILLKFWHTSRYPTICVRDSRKIVVPHELLHLVHWQVQWDLAWGEYFIGYGPWFPYWQNDLSRTHNFPENVTAAWCNGLKGYLWSTETRAWVQRKAWCLIGELWVVGKES